MPNNRVRRLLAAYFQQPHREYARVAMGIRNKGGLTTEEVCLIESEVLQIDAATIIRHIGRLDDAARPQCAGE